MPKKYFSQFNGGLTYYIKKNGKSVHIYKKDYQVIYDYITENDYDSDIDIDMELDPDKFFPKLVKSYDNVKKVFSYGGSVLVKITNFEYVFIGENVVEFITDDNITQFHSPCFDTTVDYPVAMSAKNIYFMLTHDFIPKKKFPKDTFFPESYDLYYGKTGTIKYDKYAIPMVSSQIISEYNSDSDDEYESDNGENYSEIEDKISNEIIDEINE